MGRKKKNKTTPTKKTAEQNVGTWMKSLEDSTSSNRTGTNLSNQEKTKDFDTTASLTVNSSPELEMGLFRLPLYTVRYL